MAIGTTSYPPIRVLNAVNQSITQVTMPNADTEYSLVLRDNLNQLRIKCRNSATLRIAFVEGDTATNYWTINKGCSDNIDGLSFSGKTLYLRSDKPTTTVEVMELFS